jgi:tetratricopeptide (TPR) repeat protein
MSILEIESILKKAIESDSLGKQYETIDAFVELEAKLTLFQIRHSGIKPSDLKSYMKVQKLAKEVVGNFVATDDGDHDELPDSPWVSRIAIYSTLLELAGKSDEAIKVLRPELMYCSCHQRYGNQCARIASGLFMRQGNYSKALDVLAKVTDWWFYAHRYDRDDIACITYAYLNEKRNDISEAIQAYRRVVDLWPERESAKLAKFRLKKFGKPGTFSKKRLLTYLDFSISRKYVIVAAHAVGKHKLTNGFEILCEILANKSLHPFFREAALEGLVYLEDDRAISFIEKNVINLKTGAGINREAVRALFKMGEKHRILNYIDSFDTSTPYGCRFGITPGYWAALGKHFDSKIRELTKSGPLLTQAQLKNVTVFCKEWRAWAAREYKLGETFVPELTWLEKYDGQTTNQLITLEGKYRNDSLISTFEEALLEKVKRNGSHRLTTEELTVLAVEALEREVNNGGYYQFFSNSSKEFTPIIVKALKRIGCLETAAITQKAIDFLELSGEITIEKIENVIYQDYDRMNGFLKEFDNEYYQKAGCLSEPLFKFIKVNRDKINLLD